MTTVHVAVGVILRGDQVFICKRPDDKHQGGKWEFPGGKVDAGETVTQALIRELNEEVGIDVLQSSPLTVIRHDYGDKQVMLDVHTVTDFASEPSGVEGQEGKWVLVSELKDDDFPVANREITALLKRAYC
ncbi:8-oxo-dGTP diphosphatase MutT [Aestuariibacter sp. A3R04]|uniref:8-oxo-dGTP diphosphatase MutT n=1 Tax=Aestuariibacter sp. A3R04 TaxID=2841571 RepID=UPI001C0A50A9|nr:8-oxo-dGTP diphosphatase MutT [Aestuariibacter sp. A3R04]MBU3021545.1 8-oxo-dGTP diphosphatase MutT [Aestuariibacter sp. A3R04]